MNSTLKALLVSIVLHISLIILLVSFSKNRTKPLIYTIDSLTQIEIVGRKSQGRQTRSRSVNSGVLNTVEPSGNKSGQKSVQNRLYQEISQHLRYPALASRLGQQGQVKLRFRVQGNGKIDQISVEQRSGFDLLDGAAVRALKALQDSGFTEPSFARNEPYSLPIRFELSEK